MKFKFCGDLDCPDWVLAGISALSGISSIKVKSLASGIMDGFLDGKLDILKVKKLWPSGKTADEVNATDTVDEMEVDATLSLCCSVLKFILHSAAKNQVESGILTDELQQLGLPKEHATALAKLHSSKGKALHETLKENSLRVSSLEKLEWRIDYPPSLISGAANPKTEFEPKAVTCWSVKDHLSGETKKHLVSMDKTQLKALLADVRDARAVMDKLSSWQA